MTPPFDPSAVVRRSRLFAGAPEPVIDRILNVLQALTFGPGDAIVCKGEQSDAVYFITEGTLRVHDGDLLLNSLGPGDVFGELSALDGSTPSATVTADTVAQVLRLDRGDLHDVIGGSPDAAMAVIQGLCTSLRLRVSDIGGDRQQIQALERELEIGRTIQASFLPTQIPQVPGWRIVADLTPAREVAGDFYDVFALSRGNRIALVIGDVCGKGVGAALFMALFRTLVHAGASAGIEGEPTAASATPSDNDSEFLAGIATRVNDYVAKVHSRAGMFTTLFLATLDPATGRLVYVNAGHEPPVVMNSRAERLRLESTGPVVGLFPGARFAAAEAPLVPGDMLFCYTDGVTESRASDGAFFGEEQMLRALMEGDLDSDTALAAVKRAVALHAGDAPQSDDMTVLIADWMGK
jgi:serine phosphatase RsbU (regulator of sigma subunit)